MEKKRLGWLWGPAAVLVFGLWHLLEVQAGAGESGDTWLIFWYLVLLAAVILGAGILGYLFQERKRDWTLERIYPLAGLTLGLFYLFVLPPLSAPDEISHYISAYQLSSHMLGKEANYETGHVLVRARDWFLEDTYGAYLYEEDPDGIWKKTEEAELLEEKTPSGQSAILGQTLTEQTYALIHDMGLSGEETPQEQALSGEELLAVSSYPPVVTTPLAYVPQAIGVSVARLLDLNSMWLAYLGRLFNLLFFVAVTWFSMKRLPFGKEVLFGVAMLPMTLHLSASFSYDVMILACMFYFTAICLDLAYRRETVRPLDVALLALLMAVAGPCKMVYAPMLGLCLLIPVKKFGGWARWGISAAVVTAAFAAAMVLINSQTIIQYATVAEDAVVPWSQEAGYSLTLLIHRPVLLLRMLYNTIATMGEQYHLTMIGASLGNLDPVLSVPYIAVVLLTGCLILLALKKPGETAEIRGGRRLWVFVVCLGCLGAVLVSMLIAWTPLSSPYIQGVQGRYFLPFLPVLLMACKNDGLVLTKDRNRSILYLMYCVNGYALLRLFATVSMRI